MKFGLHKEETEPAAEAAPLDSAEFAALTEPFASLQTGRLAVAVSGGPDSMALAWCVKRRLDETQTGATMLALVVDHGLRGESAAEAAQVQKTLAAHGIEAEILRWQHPPVTAKLHETARKARYRLLIETCRKRGISGLLLAHQREDQAETILMRLAKGSGIEGLAGMRAEAAVEGVRLLRPLLGIPKARLVATCRAAGIAFVSDPSNPSEKFARGRLRRVLPLLAAEGLDVERLHDLGARAAEAADALDHYASALLRVGTVLDEAGAIRIDLEHFRAAPRAIALRALGACLQAVHAADYAPPRASLISLLDALCTDDDAPPRTLHGCLVSKNASLAAIMREVSAIADRREIGPGESAVWDGRWRVTLEAGAGARFGIRALGSPPHDLLDRLAPALRRRVPQGRARAGLPGLWLNDALALIPALPCMPEGMPAAAARAELMTPWPPAFRRPSGY